MYGKENKIMHTVDKELKDGSPITLHKSYVEWTSPDGKFTCWKVIAETRNGLEWLYVWNNEELANHQGMVFVEFYRDKKQHRCIKRK